MLRDRENGERGRRPSGYSVAVVVTLVSFDIDGTLEVGQPPGIVRLALVRRAQQLGYLIGSCSDRPVSFQQEMWRRVQIVADFTVLKHRLDDVKARFAADAYYHIGDTDTDDFYATASGFRFLRADIDAHRAWVTELFAEPRG
jgi:hypothetical protein